MDDSYNRRINHQLNVLNKPCLVVTVKNFE